MQITEALCDFLWHIYLATAGGVFVGEEVDGAGVGTGALVGPGVGPEVGPGVGTGVGGAGASEGLGVGTGVGAFVGQEVGALVGPGVGFFVGDVVPTEREVVSERPKAPPVRIKAFPWYRLYDPSP